MNETPNYLQRAVLGALWCVDRPLTLDELMRDTFVSAYHKAAVQTELADLLRRSFVDYFPVQAAYDVADLITYWRVTKHGRFRFLADVSGYHSVPNAETKTPSSETLKAAAEAASPSGETAAPADPTVCNAQEPTEAQTVRLCVDEDELDAWWSSLDVDLKADAFMELSLHMYNSNSYVHVERGIPLVGSAGETAEEWNAKAAQLNSRAVPQ